ncbi:MAG: tRNA 4-thiouridine(8) synthase ThiI [Patescibacteria group bacterium]
MRKKIKALVLFSGGLDSILAVKILEKQGIKATAVNFPSYFFNSEQAKKSAKKNKIKLKIIKNDFSNAHWQIVKNPKYGYGKAINPCVDCHLLMIKKAGEIMKKQKYDFISTGEVLGQRPFSQNKHKLQLIERVSGLMGKLLRPLSARLLNETEIEKKGLVDRKKLLDFEGRGRKRQIELAKQLKVKYYPLPAGGCILCEKEFSQRLKMAMEKLGANNIKADDLELLRFSRQFWFGKNLVIVGKNKEENEKLEKLKKKRDVLIKPINPGPSILIKGRQINQKTIKEADYLIKKYSKI